MKFDQSKIEKTLKNKGYAYFENGEYNLNIVGIRNSDTGKRVTNQFDDWMTLSYKENGVWKYLEWPCTVDNGDGTARLVEGQYRGSFTIGLHQGKYTALKQCKQLQVQAHIFKSAMLLKLSFLLQMHQVLTQELFLSSQAQDGQAQDI